MLLFLSNCGVGIPRPDEVGKKEKGCQERDFLMGLWVVIAAYFCSYLLIIL